MTSDGSMEALREMMEARLYEWSQSEKKRPSQPGPVVTISREPGCRGDSIAEKVAAELGLHLYTWEIVEQIAKDEHVSVQVASTLDEKARTELEDWLAGFQGTHNLSEYAYLKDLKKITFAIAAHGNALILGRGASFLLPSEKRIALLLVAPLALRIRNVMEDRGISEKDAQDRIIKVEAEHHQYGPGETGYYCWNHERSHPPQIVGVGRLHCMAGTGSFENVASGCSRPSNPAWEFSERAGVFHLLSTPCGDFPHVRGRWGKA